jgi:hypothetical protein
MNIDLQGSCLLSRVPAILTSVLIILLLAGCNLASGMGVEPTRSADEVLATAKAAAEVTKQATLLTPPPTPIPPTLTPTPGEPTSTPTNTPAPAQVTIIAKYNVYARVLPGEEHGHVGFFFQGEEAEAYGRFEHLISGSWFRIILPDTGTEAWVWNGAVDMIGDSSGLPVVENP